MDSAPTTSARFCCGTEQIISQLRACMPPPQTPLHIADAVKAHDAAGSSYIVYLIFYEEREVRRRYSDFSSLRHCLKTRHPTLVVPPIPEKHSLVDYATKQTRAKHDPQIIGLRKRMLESFLNRLLAHPILAADHMFHRFLEPAMLWSDVLRSAQFSPSSNLQPSYISPCPTSASSSSLSSLSLSTTAAAVAASSLLANPRALIPTALLGASAPRHTDPEFAAAEARALKLETHVKEILEKSHCRLMRKYAGLSHDYCELATAYNAFSLTEAPGVAGAIERLGSCMDFQHQATSALCARLQEHVTEPLHEYALFCDEIKTIIAYRASKQVELETARDMLDSKRVAVAQLEKVESESARIEDALRRSSDAGGAGVSGQRISPSDAKLSVAALTMVPKRSIVGNISHRLNTFMDVDPETTRRNNFARMKEVIVQLQENHDRLIDDAEKTNSSMRIDLERFHRRKANDIVRMMRAYAQDQVIFCQRHLAEWEETRNEFSKIMTNDDDGSGS